jgi:hypothetical protein
MQSRRQEDAANLCQSSLFPAADEGGAALCCCLCGHDFGCGVLLARPAM